MHAPASLAALIALLAAGTSLGGEAMIEVEGGSLHALRGEETCAEPPPARGGQPVVVLLHGANFQAQTWADTGTLAALCRAGIASIAVDLPGFGRTAAFDHDPVRLLAQLADAAGGRIVLVSPSMSGRYALPWLRTSPAAAAGFVAVAPVGLARWTTPEGFGVPTLGIWGSEDRIVPASLGEQLVASIPGARLLVYEGGRHPVYLDFPDRFNADLVAFVRAVSEGGGEGSPPSP